MVNIISIVGDVITTNINVVVLLLEQDRTKKQEPWTFFKVEKVSKRIPRKLCRQATFYTFNLLKSITFSVK